MKSMYLAAVAALALGQTACARNGASCCGGEATTSPSSATQGSPSAELRSMSIQEVAELVRARDGRTVVFDANPRKMYETRHVPGARWVAYDAVTTEILPADRSATVVFYCASSQCSASHHAAQTATSLGWTHVFIMPEGISGWVRAGMPTEPG
jgi:rhodanese-related sulfurtransferase